jgi:hypothetical protein
MVCNLSDMFSWQYSLFGNLLSLYIIRRNAHVQKTRQESCRYRQSCRTNSCYSCTDSTSKSKKKTHIIIAVVVSICALAIILALTGMYIWRTKKTKARRQGPSNWSGGLHSRELHSEGNSHGDDLDLPLFDLETIASATNGFSADNKLGEGGFGPVYKVCTDI